MGVKVIKVGSPVIVGGSHLTKVSAISHGVYKVASMPPGDTVNRYSAADLKYSATEKKGLKRTPIKSKPARINKMSQKLKILLQIYKILRDKFLLSFPRCAAQLPQCTTTATEVHHVWGRDNLLLIMVQGFRPLCAGCHRILTDDSDLAINMELSLPRISVTESDLSEEEQQLLTEYNYHGRLRIDAANK